MAAQGRPAQGYVVAEYNMGHAYERGNGVPQDYRRAAAWYRKAAANGSAPAAKALERIAGKVPPKTGVPSHQTVLFDDNFQGPRNWYQATTSRMSFRYTSGLYEISTTKPSTSLWTGCRYLIHHAFDHPYLVELVARVVPPSGSADAAVGLIFNYVDKGKRFNWIDIGATGRFLIGLHQNGRNRIVELWTPDPAIRRAGFWNRVKLYQYASHLVVDVNGTEIADLPGVKLPHAPLGVSLLLENSQKSGRGTTTAQFTHFALVRLD